MLTNYIGQFFYRLLFTFGKLQITGRQGGGGGELNCWNGATDDMFLNLLAWDALVFSQHEVLIKCLKSTNMVQCDF